MVMREGTCIWSPPPRPPRDSQLDRFLQYLREGCGLEFSTYAELWKYSASEIEPFWDLCWRYLNVVGDRPHILDDATPPISKELHRLVLTSHEMPGFRFFEGSKLNFAENAYKSFQGSSKVISVSETRPDKTVIGAEELWREVARIADGLRELGVSKGDRVAAYLPNIEEALIACLATASVGAIWSCCSPDFGVSSVVDRFSQIEPKVLFSVDGYVFSGKKWSRTDVVEELVSKLPSVEAVVIVGYLESSSADMNFSFDCVGWKSVGRPDAPIVFEPMEFSDPLWILYSSGTTGLPKPIVHGHGGIVMELKKELAFQLDLSSETLFFWYTTTGWMMWNFLVGGLLVGSDILLFDGDPSYPTFDRLWRLVEGLGVTDFGASAPYVMSCMKAGTDLGKFVFSRLRFLGSTGAPLPLAGFEWLYAGLSGRVQIASVSGGTDLCTAFLASSPMSPTYAGKISARTLGSAVECFSAEGIVQYGKVGELVITEPCPSMPLYLWGDLTGDRMKASYYSTFSGVWRHGDLVRIDSDGSSIIYGRSDATLNRGGIRMGTAEFYGLIEGFQEIADSLVIDTSALGRDGELLVFVVPAPGATVGQALIDRINASIRKELSPRHVPNRFVVVPEIPRTMNGKKLEVPVRKLLVGGSMKDISLEAVANPESFRLLIEAEIDSRVRK